MQHEALRSHVAMARLKFYDKHAPAQLKNDAFECSMECATSWLIKHDMQDSIESFQQQARAKRAKIVGENRFFGDDVGITAPPVSSSFTSSSSSSSSSSSIALAPALAPALVPTPTAVALGGGLRVPVQQPSSSFPLVTTPAAKASSVWGSFKSLIFRANKSV